MKIAKQKIRSIVLEALKPLKERVKPGDFYPKDFNQFLMLLENYKDYIWVFFDTETTGFEQNKGEDKEIGKPPRNQITQIACLAYDPKDWIEKPEQIGQFNIKVRLADVTKGYLNWEKRKMKEPEFASRYTDDPSEMGWGPGSKRGTMTAIFKMTDYGKRTTKFAHGNEVLDDFEAFLSDMEAKSEKGIVIVAQNSPFDVRFINKMYERLGRTPPDYEVWDTVPIFKKYLEPAVKKIQDKETQQRVQPPFAGVQKDLSVSSLDQNISQELNSIGKRGPYISMSLGKLIKAFDIKNKGWHDALADVDMTMSALWTVINYLRD